MRQEQGSTPKARDHEITYDPRESIRAVFASQSARRLYADIEAKQSRSMIERYMFRTRDDLIAGHSDRHDNQLHPWSIMHTHSNIQNPLKKARERRATIYLSCYLKPRVTPTQFTRRIAMRAVQIRAIAPYWVDDSLPHLDHRES